MRVATNHDIADSGERNWRALLPDLQAFLSSGVRWKQFQSKYVHDGGIETAGATSAEAGWRCGDGGLRGPRGTVTQSAGVEVRSGRKVETVRNVRVKAGVAWTVDGDIQVLSLRKTDDYAAARSRRQLSDSDLATTKQRGRTVGMSSGGRASDD